MSKFNATHKTPDGTLLHSEGGKYWDEHNFNNFGPAYTGPVEALDEAERRFGKWITIPWAPATLPASTPFVAGCVGGIPMGRDGTVYSTPVTGVHVRYEKGLTGSPRWTLTHGSCMAFIPVAHVAAYVQLGDATNYKYMANLLMSGLGVGAMDAADLLGGLIDDERAYVAAARQPATTTQPVTTGQPQQGTIARLQAAGIALDLKQNQATAHKATWLVAADVRHALDVETELKKQGVVIYGGGYSAVRSIDDFVAALMSWHNSVISAPHARVYFLDCDCHAPPAPKIRGAALHVLSNVTDTPDQKRYVTSSGAVL